MHEARGIGSWFVGQVAGRQAASLADGDSAAMTVSAETGTENMLFATGAITGIHPIGPGQHCRVEVAGGPSVELRTADARTLMRS